MNKGKFKRKCLKKMSKCCDFILCDRELSIIGD